MDSATSPMDSDTEPHLGRTSLLDDLLADYATPNTDKWEHEPTTRSYLRRFGEQSGIYIMRPHSAYRQRVDDVFKVGRCDHLNRRFQDYRGAMTIVGFVPTPFPRVVEMLTLGALRRFVVHGRETVRLPLTALLEVCWAVHRAVERFWHPRTRHLVGEAVFHKESDRMLRSIVKVCASLNSELRCIDVEALSSPKPLSPPSASRRKVQLMTAKVVDRTAVKRPIDDHRPALVQKKRRTIGRRSSQRESVVDICFKIQCPYERLARLCKVRTSTTTSPSDYDRLDSGIQSTKQTIEDRITALCGNKEADWTAQVQAERTLLERFDGRFWKKRLMTHWIVRLDACDHSINPIGSFVNVRCIRDAADTPREEQSFVTAVDLFQAYYELGNGDNLSMNRFGQLLTVQLGGQKSAIKGPKGKQVRGRFGIRLKTTEELKRAVNKNGAHLGIEELAL